MQAQVQALGDRCPRTRLLQGGDEAGRWELWRRVPHRELSGLVLDLWAGLSPDPCRHRVLPNGAVGLMFHLGASQRLIERDGAPCEELLQRGFVSGIQERPINFEAFVPATRVVSAGLSPLGAWLLLGGLPQAELTHRVVAIDDVLQRGARVVDLHEQMLHAADLGRALDLFEGWLLRRRRTAPVPHVATRVASALLWGTQGALSVSGIARRAGVSPRRLRELFLEQVGVSPKRLARIQRFGGALERLVHAPRADLGQLALECGYYDQPHMNRDFRELALMTPLEYAAAVGDALDGVHVVPG